ncbi:hypothetical protein [Candidatus Nitrosocosmicus franklandus]|uniref:hypothetical protein n=1 Tax=Candidatus Nitrosocosmicus franklandianus TaxID=1798806 RepID=UPI001559729D|nr:hypothetical protein [Candidatus Nitrosocosmicus franklandus]
MVSRIMITNKFQYLITRKHELECWNLVMAHRCDSFQIPSTMRSYELYVNLNVVANNARRKPEMVYVDYFIFMKPVLILSYNAVFLQFSKVVLKFRIILLI